MALPPSASRENLMQPVTGAARFNPPLSKASFLWVWAGVLSSRFVGACSLCLFYLSASPSQMMLSLSLSLSLSRSPQTGIE
jgi:hypothetical protein